MKPTKQPSTNPSEQLSLTERKSLPATSGWAQLRRLGVFQLKLAIDALRDLLLSPFSIVATLVDISQDNSGRNSYFEKLLRFGRKSERRINLFNQYDENAKQVFTVDSVVNQIENLVKKEYQEGELSTTAKKAFEKSIQTLRKTGNFKNSE